MTILVTGASGTVGRYLSQNASIFSEPLVLAPKSVLNITNLDAVMNFFDRHDFSTTINLAAATDLDRAEKEPQWAFEVNTLGAWNIALAAQRFDVEMIQFSTVGLFGADGNTGPYTEFDRPEPLNVYARTKLAAEVYVQHLVPKSYIVRTAWVMGGGKEDQKFVGKIRDRLLAGTPVQAPDDSFGSPTYAYDLTQCLGKLIQTRAYGLYHVTNQGGPSRYEMACFMRDTLHSSSEISPVSIQIFDLAATRPKSEVTQHLALSARGIHMRPWQNALDAYLKDEW